MIVEARLVEQSPVAFGLPFPVIFVHLGGDPLLEQLALQGEHLLLFIGFVDFVIAFTIVIQLLKVLDVLQLLLDAETKVGIGLLLLLKVQCLVVGKYPVN